MLQTQQALPRSHPVPHWAGSPHNWPGKPTPSFETSSQMFNLNHEFMTKKKTKRSKKCCFTIETGKSEVSIHQNVGFHKFNQPKPGDIWGVFVLPGPLWHCAHYASWKCGGGRVRMSSDHWTNMFISKDKIQGRSFTEIENTEDLMCRQDNSSSQGSVRSVELRSERWIIAGAEGQSLVSQKLSANHWHPSCSLNSQSRIHT